MCPTLQENAWIKGLVKSDFFSDRSAQDNISPNVCEHLFRSRNNRLQTSLCTVKKNHTSCLYADMPNQYTMPVFSLAEALTS